MPFTAVAHKKTLKDAELNTRIVKLYDVSPEFADGESALGTLKAMLAKGDILYLGMFNEKPIAAVTVRGTGKTKLVQYIVVHPANRGRGLAQRLIKDVCEQEMENGVQDFEAGCGAIHNILTDLNLLNKSE